jgi:hypothetical protein
MSNLFLACRRAAYHYIKKNKRGIKAHTVPNKGDYILLSENKT